MRTNYPAVLVAAIAYWILGALWYGVAFSKPWMALEHMSEEQARSMSPVLPFVITFLLNLVIAYAIAVLSPIGLGLGFVWARTRSLLLVVLLHTCVDLLPGVSDFAHTWGIGA